jgi:hypothetical protein
MNRSQGSGEISDTLLDLAAGASKILLGLGGACTVISLVLLGMLCMSLSHDSSHGTQALQNIELFGRILSAGVVGIAVGANYLWWGEELAVGLMLIFSAALYFAPLYLPSIFSESSTNAAMAAAFGAVQTAGLVFGLISILSTVVQVTIAVRERVKVGTKADHLKFGKGIKEEADRKNVFMGNCWQLPYCRKFVRERCPIFHSKRTCWKERVGCMCEEEVIRNAMENKPIPRDAVLAGNMIPKNHRLTPQQKFERCKTCVIYNEHQRHKYKLMLPVTVLSFVVGYVLLHNPLVATFGFTIERINRVIHNATLSGGGSSFVAPTAFVECLMFVCALMLLTYALKVLEFVIFKLKI